MTLCPVNAALRWIVLFGYQAIFSARSEPDTTSVSPSPSRSAAKIESPPPAAPEVKMMRAVQVGGWAPLFSNQAIVLCVADTASGSPSPSRPVARTHVDWSMTVEMVRLFQVGVDASLFSYQAIAAPEAESTSVSPSPSKSVAKITPPKLIGCAV